MEYPKKNGKVGKVLFYNNGFCRNTKVESGNPDIVARVVENYGHERKTMALCIDCHDKLHAGKLD